MTKHRVLIIGGGDMGLNHYKTLKKFQEEGRVEIVGVVDTNPDKLDRLDKEGNPVFPNEDVNKYTSLDQALHDSQPSVVMINPNTEMHRDTLEKIISSGLKPALFVEKPIVGTYPEAVETEKRLREAGYGEEGIPISTAYLINSSPIVQDAVELLKNNELSIESYEIIWTKQRGNQRATANVVRDESTHGINTVNSIDRQINGRKGNPTIEYILANGTLASDEPDNLFYNIEAQRKLYTDPENLNPIGRVEYEIRIDGTPIKGLSSFMGPKGQKRMITINCKDKNERQYKIELDFDQNWVDTVRVIEEKTGDILFEKGYNAKENHKYQKVYAEWNHFFNYIETGVRPIEIPSLGESTFDTEITDELTRMCYK